MVTTGITTTCTNSSCARVASKLITKCLKHHYISTTAATATLLHVSSSHIKNNNDNKIPQLSDTKRNYYRTSQCNDTSHRYIFSSASGGGNSNNNNNDNDPHALFKEQMEQLQREREDMFGFTEEDHAAWSNTGQGQGGDVNDTLPKSLMDSVDYARQQQAAAEEQQEQGAREEQKEGTTMFQNNSNNYNSSTVDSTTDYQPSHGLTHITEDGSSVHMVNVGSKTATKRMAKAETKIILPPEVVEALQTTTTTASDSSSTSSSSSSQEDETKELIGSKGPIFATAKIAGIMAAKKTSDMIPLCHPLPLEKVQINISMQSSNIIVITCECYVTHKTGVEMEALTGASIAALTIYDMIKAISHDITIESTKLISKSGGKRTVR